MADLANEIERAGPVLAVQSGHDSGSSPPGMKPLLRPLSAATVVALGLLRVSHAATPPADVSNDAIRCATVIATASISPPLTFGGTASSVRIRIKGTLAGCVDLTNPRVTIDSGSFHGTLVGTTNDCFALTARQPLTGSLTYRWKANAETPIVPTSSVQSVEFLSGASFAPAPVLPALSGASYLALTLGSGRVTGAFTGGDAGAASRSVVVTSESATVFTSQCGVLGAGVRTLHFGIGSITLQ